MRKKNFISFLAGFLCCLLAAGAGLGAGAAGQTITVSQDVKMVVEGEDFAPTDANGKELPIFVYEDSTYAPVRALGKAVGCDVRYDQQDRTVRVEVSPKPDYLVEKALEEKLEEQMMKVKTIMFRDETGKTAVVDALPDGGEMYGSWLGRLWFYNRYYKVETEDGKKPEDYQGSGIDVMFLDEDGDCVYKYKDISEHYVTINGEYYTNNLHGGGDLDVDRIRRVLDGKPEEFEPEKLFHIEGTEWIIISEAHGGKDVRVDDPEMMAQLTDEINSLEYRRGEPWAGWTGCPQYTIYWYNAEGRCISSLATNPGGMGIRAPRFNYEVVGGAIDTDRYDRLLEELPEAEYWDTDPIRTFSGALRSDKVSIEDGMATYRVIVTDPELVKRIAENIGNMEFRLQGHVEGSAWDQVGDGRCFVYWSRQEEDYSTPAEATVCVLDEINVAFSGDNGYRASAMDGKTIDKALLDALLDRNGPYANHPGVEYKDY